MYPSAPGRIQVGRRAHSIRNESGVGWSPCAWPRALTSSAASVSSRTRRSMATGLEDLGELQRLGLPAPVPPPAVLGTPLADDREADPDVGEPQDVGPAVRPLAPGDAFSAEHA